jgi:hypothetical protein
MAEAAYTPDFLNVYPTPEGAISTCVSQIQKEDKFRKQLRA